MTYEIINGWIVGKLPGQNGDLIPVKHFPQGPYERRRRNKPLLCLHTTETDGYVEDLRFPTEFQVGEDVIGQHRPLWARGAAVDEHDHDLLQIEIVGFSKLDRWLPKPSSLPPLVALMALLHRRGFVLTALRRPTRWPVPLDRLPAAVDTYYRRLEVWDHAFVYGHVEIPGDEHWDPGSLDHPVLFSMVRDVLAPKEVDGEMLSDNQLEGMQFANGMRRYLDSPENEPAEPGPHRQGFRSRSGSRRTSRVSPRQRRSNLADPRLKACSCRPTRSIPDGRRRPRTEGAAKGPPTSTRPLRAARACAGPMEAWPMEWRAARPWR